MEVGYHKRFKDQYKNLASKIRKKFNERLKIFLVNPFNSVLNNHSLSGKYKNCRSVNVTGNVRAIYALTDRTAIFITIGTHSQLYE